MVNIKDNAKDKLISKGPHVLNKPFSAAEKKELEKARKAMGLDDKKKK